MRKVVTTSVNENPIYLFTLPLVIWSWVRIGWYPHITSIGKRSALHELVDDTISKISINTLTIIDPVDRFRTDTLAQVSRLYASCSPSLNNSYIMTIDSDMMALSDYWKFDPNKITVWGFDLTSYQQIPICYIGMMAERWIEVMELTNSDVQGLMKRDLDELPDSGENGNQVDRWCTDQRLITKRINETQFEKDFIHRGTLANGYPIGRIDRSAWATYHPQPTDCHLPHDIYANDESFAKVMRMLYSVFPKDDHTWFAEYTEQFKKTLQ